MELHAIVVGGGPAGLGAALTLGRMRRRVVVLDSGEPRNGYTDHFHNYLTRDGESPAALRRLGRAELERYKSVTVRDDRAVDAAVVVGGVRVSLEHGERIEAQRLILAGGVRDELPPIDGLSDLFGASVFTCPFCDGYEAAGRPLGLICTASGQLGHAAGLLCTLSDDVSVFANGVSVTDEERTTAERLGARLFPTPVQQLRAVDGGVELLLEDGAVERRDRVFVPTQVRQSSRLAEQLGCATTEQGFLEVDELGRTSVSRVYAAGDAASGMHQVILAAASGTRSAIAAIRDAIEELELA